MDASVAGLGVLCGRCSYSETQGEARRPVVSSETAATRVAELV